MWTLISYVVSSVLGIFKTKSDTKLAEVKVEDDKVEQGTEQIKLQATQANITNNALLDHNFFVNLGIGIIWLSCGICIFHDYVIAKILADFHVYVACMTDKQVIGLVYTLIGNGTIHIAKKWMEG